MKIQNYCRLAFAGITDNEKFVRSAVAAFCSSLNPTLEEINDIKTAVSEAITNSIVHGYGEEVGEIVIEVYLLSDCVEIKIIDNGCGFENIEKAMQPFYTSKPNDERSGMGFTIMQAFMDNVVVESKVGNGTMVTMQKRIYKVKC